MIGLFQKIDEIADNTSVSTVEKSRRDTSISSTTCTTDSMNVIIDVSGKIVIDDMCDIGNIKAFSEVY